MGFGPFSSDSKTSTTTTNQNAGFSEIGGGVSSINLTGGGKKSQTNLDVSLSDYGAIAGGLEAAAKAFDFGGDAFLFGRDAMSGSYGFGADALGTVDRSVDALLSTSRDASASSAQSLVEGYDFGRSALNYASDQASDALKAVGDANFNVLDFAKSLFDQVTGANQTLTQSNLTGLTGLAKQTSASADDRVTKVAGYALLAIAAAMVLPAIIGKLK